MPKALAKPDSYKSLIAKIKKEFAQVESFIKQRSAQGAWNIGLYLHEHLLANKKDSDNRMVFYERAARDSERDAKTLRRCVQFYRDYPHFAHARNLSFEHFKSLMTIKDVEERKEIEKKAIENNWNSHKLREYVSTKRKLTAAQNSAKPIPQLVFTRGRPYTYRVIEYLHPEIKKTDLRLDVGFKMRRRFKGNFKKDETVEVQDPNGVCNLIKTAVKEEELFTYQAELIKVTDADTLIVDLDTGLLEWFIEQKLRLRGINCPEKDTPEGKRAKRFVEKRLNGREFIVIKTYKDRSDKWDRYLADVFYGDGDLEQVVREGTFLNQELLDTRLAVKYEG